MGDEALGPTSSATVEAIVFLILHHSAPMNASFDSGDDGVDFAGGETSTPVKGDRDDFGLGLTAAPAACRLLEPPNAKLNTWRKESDTSAPSTTGSRVRSFAVGDANRLFSGWNGSANSAGGWVIVIDRVAAFATSNGDRVIYLCGRIIFLVAALQSEDLKLNQRTADGRIITNTSDIRATTASQRTGIETISCSSPACKYFVNIISSLEYDFLLNNMFTACKICEYTRLTFDDFMIDRLLVNCRDNSVLERYNRMTSRDIFRRPQNMVACSTGLSSIITQPSRIVLPRNQYGTTDNGSGINS
uniref:Uncharacterized protein n=1 Tax=Romanomermis culicivorax TaxID=13658 RepID=A0A915IX01_ROMCU